MFAWEPDYLWWGLLALPLLLLYTVRRRRREVGVPSLILWRDVVAGPAARRRLLGLLDRRLLGLVLLLGVLACLVLGLARVSTSPRRDRDVVVVLDVSPPMDAPGRLPAARAALTRLAKGLGPRDRLWVVTAGRVARVAWGPTSAPPPAGWAAVTPAEDAGPAADEALRLAERLLPDEPNRAAELWGWGLRAPAPGRLPGRVTVRWTAPPAPTIDLGLEGELIAVGEDRLTLRASVVNRTERAAVARAVVRVDEVDQVRLAPLLVPGGGRVALPVQVLERGARGHVVSLRLAADDVPHDDVLRWVVPPRAPLRVGVRGVDRFARAALAADPRVELVAEGPQVEVAGTAPPAVAGRLLLGPRALPAEAGLVRAGDRPSGAARRVRHPVMRGVDLDGLLARRVACYAPAPGAAWAPVAWAGEAPLVWVREAPERSVFLAVAPGETDLVLRRAFPILVANAVRWLARDLPAEPRWVRAGRDLPGAGRHPSLERGPAPPAVTDWPGAEPPPAPADPRPGWVLVAFALLLLEGVLFLLGRTA